MKRKLAPLFIFTLGLPLLAGCGGGHTHTLQHVDKVDSTCTQAGVREHFYCDGCGKLFEGTSVEDAHEVTLEDLKIPTIKHTLDRFNMCTHCHQFFGQEVDITYGSEYTEVTSLATCETYVQDIKTYAFAIHSHSKKAYTIKTECKLATGGTSLCAVWVNDTFVENEEDDNQKTWSQASFNIDLEANKTYYLRIAPSSSTFDNISKFSAKFLCKDHNSGSDGLCQDCQLDCSTRKENLKFSSLSMDKVHILSGGAKVYKFTPDASIIDKTAMVYTYCEPQQRALYGLQLFKTVGSIEEEITVTVNEEFTAGICFTFPIVDASYRMLLKNVSDKYLISEQDIFFSDHCIHNYLENGGCEHKGCEKFVGFSFKGSAYQIGRSIKSGATLYIRDNNPYGLGMGTRTFTLIFSMPSSGSMPVDNILCLKAYDQYCNELTQVKSGRGATEINIRVQIEADNTVISFVIQNKHASQSFLLQSIY